MRFHTTIRNTALGVVAAGAVCFGQLHTADATIVPVNYYRLGEGGSAGEDAIGSVDVAATGTPASVASGVAGSATAQDFTNNMNDGTTAGTANQFFTQSTSVTGIAGSTNWGVELWVKPDVLPDGSSQFEVGVLNIGGTGVSPPTAERGFVLEIGQNPAWTGGNPNWLVHQPGVAATFTNDAFGGVAAPAVDTWSHLVYVNNGGTGQFYVNGVMSTLGMPAVPGPTTNGLTFGAMFGNNRQGLDGQIDEVRLFTFEPGEFDINDTFVNGVPEPGSLALLCIGCVSLMGRMGRRRRRA